MVATRRTYAILRTMEPIFFPTPADFRAWLEQHHATEKELVVGFYKKGSGKPSITWPESVDEALSFGWIDGIRRRIDDESYSIRFTPRKPDSHWSSVNIRRVPELQEEGRMRPAGLAAFERRSEERSNMYSYEQRRAARFDADQEREFRSNEAAWEFFQAQPPGYRQLSIYRVVSAKREETRRRRLAALIEDSAAGRRRI
jgi:uncharacterized protein YdeI (YjbR/CyaY-like superfamily)